MNAYSLGFIVMVVTSAAAVGGLAIVRRIVKVETLRTFNEVAGSCFQVVGTFYAVLLGLIVVDAMNNMSDLRGVIEQESNAFADIYILSRGMSAPVQKKVQQLSVSYVDAVIDDEWEAMKHRRVSAKAIVYMNQLWNTLVDFKPENEEQKDIRQMCLQRISDAGDSRRSRLITSAHGVSTELWTVLIVGGLLTLSFSYFLGLPSFLGQALMTVVIASTMALNVYLVFLYGYPFSGTYCVDPDGFVLDRIIFKMRASGKDGIPDLEKVDVEEIIRMKGKGF